MQESISEFKDNIYLCPQSGPIIKLYFTVPQIRKLFNKDPNKYPQRQCLPIQSCIILLIKKTITHLVFKKLQNCDCIQDFSSLFPSEKIYKNGYWSIQFNRNTLFFFLFLGSLFSSNFHMKNFCTQDDTHIFSI